MNSINIILPGLLGALFFIAIVSVISLAAQQPVSPNITILNTNDFHGRITPFEVSPGNAISQTGDAGGRSQIF